MLWLHTVRCRVVWTLVCLNEWSSYHLLDISSVDTEFSFMKALGSWHFTIIKYLILIPLIGILLKGIMLACFIPALWSIRSLLLTKLYETSNLYRFHRNWLLIICLMNSWIFSDWVSAMKRSVAFQQPLKGRDCHFRKLIASINIKKRIID